jgi:hypothetical protein
MSVPVQVTVSLKTYKSSNVGYHIFSPGLLSPIRTQQQELLLLPFRDIVLETCPIFIFFYIQRYQTSTSIHEEKKGQPFITYIGRSKLTIRDIEKEQTRSIFDSLDKEIGKVSISVSSKPKTSYKVFVDDRLTSQEVFNYDFKSFQVLEQETAQLLTKIHKTELKGKSNMELPYFMFRGIKQAGFTVPMWLFPQIHLVAPTTKNTEAYLEHSVRNACFLLGLSNPSTQSELAECLNEMQTMAVRNQLYVVDTTKLSNGENECIDDWTNPLQFGSDAKLAGIDCEDGTLRMLQESKWLREVKLSSTASPLLRKLQKMEQGYCTFMAGMTLYLPSKKIWVYHAACLKLDKRYVNEEEEAAEYLPAIIEESTAYTTGCWEYKSKWYTQEHTEASQMSLSYGIDSVAKLTAEAVKATKNYGHVQTLFCTTDDTVQLELSYGNALGVPLEKLMTYDPKVRFHCLRMKADADKLEQFKSHFPTPELITAPLTSNNKLKPIQPKHVACSFRVVDYKSCKDELRDMQATVIDVDQFMSFVYVTK